MSILTDVFLPLSLAFIMFSLGLGLVVGDFARVLRQPVGFALGALGQLILLPIAALIIIQIFGFTGTTAIGIMILALCPGGVTSNMLAKLAKGDVALSVSLTAILSLVVVITVPLMLDVVLGWYPIAQQNSYSALDTGIRMFAIVALPVLIGMAVRHFAANWSLTFQPLASRIATALFIIVVLGAMITYREVLLENIIKLAPALVLLNLVMLAIGLGLAWAGRQSGPSATSISIETGIQNATLGIAVGNMIWYGSAEPAAGVDPSPLILASGVYGVTMYVVCLPFILWRRGKATL